MGAGRRRSRRGAQALRARGRAVQGRARRHGRRRHLALPAGRFPRPVPWAAPPERRPDQGGQAALARRRVLARRRDEAAAHARLRDGLLRPEGSRGVPPPDRGGEAPRPPAARQGARPRRLLRARARNAVLASARDGGLERPRGPPPAGEPPPRLRRDPDAAALRRGALDDLGALGQVPGRHVHARDRGAAFRPQAHELPRPLRPLRPHGTLVP